MDLSLETQDRDGVTVVAVGGEVDVYTAPRLRDRLAELVAQGHTRILVDLEAVEFMDSTGLWVLVGGLKKVRAQGGSMDLLCSQERLQKVFRITGLDKVFTIHQSQESAGAALRG